MDSYKSNVNSESSENPENPESSETESPENQKESVSSNPIDIENSVRKESVEEYKSQIPIISTVLNERTPQTTPGNRRTRNPTQHLIEYENKQKELKTEKDIKNEEVQRIINNKITIFKKKRVIIKPFLKEFEYLYDLDIDDLKGNQREEIYLLGDVEKINTPKYSFLKKKFICKCIVKIIYLFKEDSTKINFFNKTMKDYIFKKIINQYECKKRETYDFNGKKIKICKRDDKGNIIFTNNYSNLEAELFIYFDNNGNMTDDSQIMYVGDYVRSRNKNFIKNTRKNRKTGGKTTKKKKTNKKTKKKRRYQ